jgi:hypothetical protein
MNIPLSHLTDDDLYQRGYRLNTKRLLTESRKKLKYAQDRKDALPALVGPAEFTAIEAQRTLVKTLRQQRKASSQGSLALTAAQEGKLENLMKVNSELMDLVDLAIRLKLLKNEGYRRGETPGRTVKNWEDLAEERLQQARADKTVLLQVGLTDNLLSRYEKALEELATTDDEQESKKPKPGQAVRALAIARGKLAYMLVWLCGLAEHALRNKPEEAKLFLTTDLLRERSTNQTPDEETDAGDEGDTEDTSLDDDETNG